MKDIVLPIAVAVITLSGSFLVGVLNPDSIFINPEFKIKVGDGVEQKSNSEYVQVLNDGWVQAKNVRLSINTYAIENIDHSNCKERILFIENDASSYTVDLERMSINMPCVLYFEKTFENSTVQWVGITADDSPAFQWIKSSNITERLSDTIRQLVLISIAIISLSLSSYALLKMYRIVT